MTIHVERTARKKHRCEQCSDPILPGQRYWDCRLPPGSDVGNRQWWRSKSHSIPGCLEWALRPGMVGHS